MIKTQNHNRIIIDFNLRWATFFFFFFFWNMFSYYKIRGMEEARRTWYSDVLNYLCPKCSGGLTFALFQVHERGGEGLLFGTAYQRCKFILLVNILLYFFPFFRAFPVIYRLSHFFEEFSAKRNRGITLCHTGLLH